MSTKREVLAAECKRCAEDLAQMARYAGTGPETRAMRALHAAIDRLAAHQPEQVPIDMVLHCPKCHTQHIDAPEEHWNREFLYSWENPPHRSHLCHHCGHIWRPADVPTNGVAAVKTRGKDDSPIAKPAAHQPEQRAVVVGTFTAVGEGPWPVKLDPAPHAAVPLVPSEHVTITIGGDRDERQVLYAARLKSAGDALSNCAFNLAQKAGEVLTQREADTLDRCRKEWDAARQEQKR
jgi:hypothetical protein